MTFSLNGPSEPWERAGGVKGKIAAEPIVAAMVDALVAAGEMAQRFAAPMRVGP